MSKSTIILLLILFSVISIFFVYKNSYLKKSTVHTNPLLQATPTPESESTLTLIPGSLTIINGKRSAVDVVLDQKGYPPTLIQLEIVYDPNVLTNFQIVPGNFFTNPTVLLNTNDEKTGRISYAVKPSDQEVSNKNKGIAATIFFTPKAGVSQTETSLYFLPKSAVKIQDKINTLKSMYGTRILIGTGTVPPATPSGQIKK
jgi:Cohesin domain